MKMISTIHDDGTTIIQLDWGATNALSLELIKDLSILSRIKKAMLTRKASSWETPTINSHPWIISVCGWVGQDRLCDVAGER